MNAYRMCVGLIMLASAFSVGSARAGGLSTPLGEVVVENLQIGQTYHLRHLANLSLRVTNRSDHPLDLQMDVLAPDASELRQGSEAVPDVHWIELSQDGFTLPPGGEAASDIRLTIPDDPQLLGRKFQFMIWSHSLPGAGGGMALAYGLKSRIIFTIDSVRAEAPKGPAAAPARAAVRVQPQEIHLQDVPRGARWAGHAPDEMTLTLSNPADTALRVRLHSRTVGESHADLTPGYHDTPDASFLTFEQDEVTVPAGGSSAVRMYLSLPADARWAGEHIMFIIHAETLGQPVATGVYARLYASVR